MKILPKEILVTLLMALVLYLGLQAIMTQIVVQQKSMLPTLVEGQRLFIGKASYLFGDPQRGDIIVFHPPESSDGTPLIKRVIGLPGETVEVKSGSVCINGVALEEPYIREAPGYVFASYEIPVGQYFVLGDNRNQSRDSHTGWTVSRNKLVGKALFCVWPPNQWGAAPNYAYAD